MQVSEIIELLDNSQDAETIALEIVSHETLNEEVSCFWDDLLNANVKSEGDTLATIIRELWDIAYSHGYYDGRMEENEGII